jgi:uncharacterized protein YndB with AHSA1/START domain
MTTPARAPLPPVRKSLHVPWTPEASFTRFTADIAAWWPLRSHSVGGDRAETVVFEPRTGGIYERIRGGEESTWGTVTAWEPPIRVAFTWHPGRPPASAQRVEVRFTPEGTGTRLELVHEGWETFGTMAARVRRGYGVGWAYVLRLWADRRSSVVVWGMDAVPWLLSPLQRRFARRAEAAAGGPAS